MVNNKLKYNKTIIKEIECWFEKWLAKRFSNTSILGFIVNLAIFLTFPGVFVS